MELLIDLWNKNKNYIKFYNKISNKNNYDEYEITFNNPELKFKITNFNNTYQIDSIYNIEWIQKLNFLIIKEKYDSTKLDKILNCIYNKIKDTNINTYILNNNFISNINSIEENLNKIINSEDNQITKNKLEILKAEFLDIYNDKSRKFLLKLNNNNLNSWIITLNNLSHKNNININSLNIIIDFDLKSYPYNPPSISFCKDSLKFIDLEFYNKLLSLKMIKLEYWNPTRNSKYIINKLYDIILSNNIFIQETKSNISFDKEKYNKFNKLLIELASYCDYKIEELDKTEYIKNTTINNNKSIANNSSNYWSKGTGYGTGDIMDNWKIDEYIKLINEKESKLSIILNNIFELIDFDTITFLESSCFMYYFIYQIDNTSLTDILNKSNIFIPLINIFNNYPENNINKNYINNLTTIKTKLVDEMKLYTKFENSNNLDIINILINKINNILKNYTIIEDKKKEYLFEADIINQPNSNYLWMNKYKELQNIKYQKRMIKELNILKNNLPDNKDVFIYVSYDPNTISALRALIVGPHDTPYQYGLFIFDIFIQSDFPNNPPYVYLNNTGGDRFNPNLYDSGKVCLSILNTWGNNPNERWNANTSTILQILLSIQSLIMVDKPYFNEPGYEKNINTSDGIRKSDLYNLTIEYFTLKNAILNLINDINDNNNKYPQFTNIIKKYFSENKENIIKHYNNIINKNENLFLKYKDYKNEYKNYNESIKSLLKIFTELKF